MSAGRSRLCGAARCRVITLRKATNIPRDGRAVPLAGTVVSDILALAMNSGTPLVLLAACSGICLSALNAAGSMVQRDLTLIANPASPEKQFAAELDDLRERLAVVDARILAEENEERREELRRKRESILTREKTVRHSLDLARIEVKTLKAAHGALLANLAVLDVRISAEDDEARLKELRRERAFVIKREEEVRRP